MAFRDCLADEKKSTAVVLFCGVLLRVLLAAVNAEANDPDHIDVIRIIADEHRIPAKHEVGEAFQPKLYHATVAALWRVAPTRSPAIRVRIAQFVSCTAGILTLLLLLRFLSGETALSGRVRLLSFALLALNPDLIGIAAQATNDSFVILFGSVALFFGYRFFQTFGTLDFWWMTGGAILAGLSKGNGLVAGLAIAATFGTALVVPARQRRCRKLALYASIFVVGVSAIVTAGGPYWSQYRRYGAAFGTNFPVAPLPHWVEKTVFGYPGVTSVVDSFLTFRLIDMLEHPTDTTGPVDYPLHRTSHWSQLYGRAHYVHFSGWPRSWQLSPDSAGAVGTLASVVVRNIGRAVFVFALVPTAMLVVAVGRRIGVGVRWFKMRESAPLDSRLVDFAAGGYLVFSVVYALRYRDYSVMKAVFIFPGILAFSVLFARECERFYAWCSRRRKLVSTVDMLFVVLLLLYAADVTALIGQLGAQLLARRT